MTSIKFVGLDVHAETISAAVVEANGKVRALGTIANRPEALAKLMKSWGRRRSFEPATRLVPRATASTGSSLKLGVRFAT
jgi:hypothetical protein